MFTNRIFQSVIVLAIGVFTAIWLGLNIVTEQTATVVKIIAAVLFLVCFFLGRRIWLIIPFLTAVNLQVRIPTMPNTLLVAQIIVLSLSLLLVATRRLKFRPVFTELELWMCGLAILVAQVYIRNPAGVNFFGTEIIGGKPYFTIAITLICALLLCSIKVEEKDLERIFPLIILGSLVNVSIGVLGRYIPVVGYYTGATYNINDSNVGEAIDEGKATRLVEVSIFGRSLALWISCFKNPLTAAIRPIWMFMILLSLTCALVGGFRSGFAALILTYFVGIWYRGGFRSVIFSSIAASFFLILLALINNIAPLPPNIQRSLTFLPGTWEQRYKDDADGSTDWRVEVWKEVLFTDRWINNKIIGDGLGFTKKQLDYQLSLTEKTHNRTGASGWDLHREAVLASGDYHSGPVSTIRVIGYVGLVYLVLFQIRLAIHAHRQIIRCRGTKWHPLSLLLGIPLIWSPFFYFFIFGDFRNEAVTILMGAAMIRILERALPLPERTPSRHHFVIKKRIPEGEPDQNS